MQAEREGGFLAGLGARLGMTGFVEEVLLGEAISLIRSNLECYGRRGIVR
jgi:hypothetical protein